MIILHSSLACPFGIEAGLKENLKWKIRYAETVNCTLLFSLFLSTSKKYVEILICIYGLGYFFFGL